MDRDEFEVGNVFDVKVGWEGSGGEGVLELSDGSEGVRLDVVAVDIVEEEGVVIAYRPRIEGWFVEWRYNKLENQEDQKTKKVRNRRRGIGERRKRKFGFIENNVPGSI